MNVLINGKWEGYINVDWSETTLFLSEIIAMAAEKYLIRYKLKNLKKVAFTYHYLDFIS